MVRRKFGSSSLGWATSMVPARFSGIDASEIIAELTIYCGKWLRQAEHFACTSRADCCGAPDAEIRARPQVYSRRMNPVAEKASALPVLRFEKTFELTNAGGMAHFSERLC